MNTVINTAYPFYVCRRILSHGTYFDTGEVLDISKVDQRTLERLVKHRFLRQDFTTPLELQAPVNVPAKVTNAFVENPEMPVPKRRGRPKLTEQIDLTE